MATTRIPSVEGGIQPTLVTTTGDIIYASSASNPARLAIGSSAQVLTVSGGIPAWTTASGGGKVLQVVNVVYSTSTSNNTSTFADTGLTATITPTLNTSKVLVIVNQGGVTKTNNNSGSGVQAILLRGVTTLATFAQYETYSGTAMEMYGSCGVNYLDSPATTSATTYKTQFLNRYNGNGVRAQSDSTASTITLMEIGA